MIALQEYDLEIKIVDIIKGHGLYRLTIEVVHGLESEEELAS